MGVLFSCEGLRCIHAFQWVNSIPVGGTKMRELLNELAHLEYNGLFLIGEENLTSLPR